MTNDDLKRFYSQNSAPEKSNDFVRYNANGEIPGVGGNARKYFHTITMHKNYKARLGFTIISDDADAYTTITQIATALNNIAQDGNNFGNYPCAGYDDNYNLFISVCGNASGNGLQVRVMSAIGTAPTEISISSGYSIYDKVTEL